MIVSRHQTTSNDWEFKVLVIFKTDCVSSQTIDVHLPIFPGVLEIFKMLDGHANVEKPLKDSVIILTHNVDI